MLSLERQNELRDQYRQLDPGWRPATEVYADLVEYRLALPRTRGMSDALPFAANKFDVVFASWLLIPDPTYLAFNQSFFKAMIWFDKQLAANRQLHMVACLQKNRWPCLQKKQVGLFTKNR
jgi:hypothetical protein